MIPPREFDSDHFLEPAGGKVLGGGSGPFLESHYLFNKKTQTKSGGSGAGDRARYGSQRPRFSFKCRANCFLDSPSDDSVAATKSTALSWVGTLFAILKYFCDFLIFK